MDSTAALGNLIYTNAWLILLVVKEETRSYTNDNPLNPGKSQLKYRLNFATLRSNTYGMPIEDKSCEYFVLK